MVSDARRSRSDRARYPDDLGSAADDLIIAGTGRQGTMSEYAIAGPFVSAID